jgi:predicted enzyme involved in methoxymalonyl-ACP biosynthesis
MDYLIKTANGMGLPFVWGVYIATNKNLQVKDFYSKFAKKISVIGDRVYFCIDTNDYKPQGKDYICVRE